MTPRNYTDEELVIEVERCYTDELVLELVRRFLEGGPDPDADLFAD